MKTLIEERSEKAVQSEIAQEYMVSNDTICRQVSNREPQLKKFSADFDVIVFVSGKKSSNGKALYEVCKAVNPTTYFISSDEELESSWFKNVESVGVCGATSTPMWLMEQVARAIEAQSFN